MSWTKERVAQLTKLWQQGLSASQISAQLGNNISRNAVIGKIHRLGLNARNITSPKTVNIETQDELLAIGKNSADKSFLKTLASSNTTLTNHETKTACTSNLSDLPPHSCRWPIDDLNSPKFYFCGAPQKPGSSYCEAHFKMAYTPQKRKSGNRTQTALASQSAKA